MKRRIRLFVVLSCALGLGVCNAATLGGYSGAVKPRASIMALSHTKPYRYAVTDTIVRYGKLAERFEIRHGDCGWESGWSDCNNDRGRVEKMVFGTPLQHLGSERWYGWSLYLDPEFRDITPANTTLGQWKLSRWREPVFYFNARKGHLNLDLSQSTEERCPLIRLSDMKGKWTDIVLHVIWSKGEDGLIEVWINGEAIPRCGIRGRPVIDPRATPRHWSPVLHYGIYRSYVSRWLSQKAKKPVAFAGDFVDQHELKDLAPTSAVRNPFNHDWGVELPTAVVYYDEFRIGNSREEVDIRMIEARGGEAVD